MPAYSPAVFISFAQIHIYFNEGLYFDPVNNDVTNTFHYEILGLCVNSNLDCGVPGVLCLMLPMFRKSTPAGQTRFKFGVDKLNRQCGRMR